MLGPGMEQQNQHDKDSGSEPELSELHPTARSQNPFCLGQESETEQPPSEPQAELNADIAEADGHRQFLHQQNGASLEYDAGPMLGGLGPEDGKPAQRNANLQLQSV